MSKRLLPNWLESYLTYTAKMESPEIFHVWSGMFMISASMNRKIQLPQGHFTTWPNQYVILVSPSGKCKKSTAVKAAAAIYNGVFEDNPIYSKKLTLQKFMVNLNNTANLTQKSSGVVFSDELSVLVGRSGHCELMDFLTEVYGCPPLWDNETKTKGVDNLKDVYVNFIACTTPADFSRMPASIVDGGFTGRNILVYSDVPRPPVSNPAKHYTQDMETIKQALIHDLALISKLEGIFTVTPKAQQLYDQLYNENYYRKDRDFRLEAFYNRKGDHLYKVGMCISAARSDDLVVDEYDIAAANQFILQVEESMINCFVEMSYSKGGEHMEKVKFIIEQAGGKMPHSKLLKKVYHFMNAEELNRIIVTLESAGFISTCIDKSGSKPKKYYVKEER